MSPWTPLTSLSRERPPLLAGDVGCVSWETGPVSDLTIKKIPKTVLARCEWGKDDYSLQVENLPKAPPPPGQMELISP